MKIDEYLLEKLAEHVRQAVRQTRHIELAQIQIIGLDSIRRRAGGRWDDLAKRIRDTSADFIERRIASGDILIPAGDGFIVIYADPEQAPERSLALQFALDAFYLGQDITRDLRTQVEHSALEPEALFDHIAAPHTAPQESAAPPGPTLAVMPVWSVAQEAITGYWIAPRHSDGGGGRYAYDRGWATTGVRTHDVDFLALDLAILERAVTDAAACMATGRRCLVGYSVHETTLQIMNRRVAFLQALSKTPAELRPFLLGRMAEVEAGTPIAALSDWTHHLRAITPRMAIELHWTQKNLSGLKDLGVFSVACVLPSSRPSPSGVARYRRVIESWVRQLKREGLKFRVDNVVDPHLLSFAVATGVDFCTSERLWPEEPAAGGMRPYTMDRFRQLLPQNAVEAGRA